MKIRNQLLLGFGIVLILTIGICVFGIYNISKISKDVEAMYKQNYTRSDIISSIRRKIPSSRASLMEAIIVAKPGEKQDAINDAINHAKRVDEYEAEWKKILDQYPDQKELKEFLAFQKDIADLNTIREEIQNNIINGKADLAIDQLLHQYVPLVNNIENKLMTINVRESQQTAQFVKKANELKQKTILLQSVLLLLIVLLIILTTIIISTSINRPIKHLISVTAKIAKGDLEISDNNKANNEFGKLASSIREIVSNLQRLVVEANTLTSASVVGNFTVRAKADAFGGGYREILTGVNNTLDTIVDKIYWYESLLDSIPNPLTVTDLDMNWTFVNRAVVSMLKTTREELLGKSCTNWGSNICNTKNCGVERLRQGLTETEYTQDGRNYQITTSYLENAIGEKVGHIELGRDITKDRRKTAYQTLEVERLAQNLAKLAEGNLNLNLTITPADEYTQEDHDNFARINNSLGDALSGLALYISEIERVLSQIAKGNLNIEATGDFKGDFTQIKLSLNQIIVSLNVMLQQINQSSSQVLNGASHIASASQSLARGSTEQASAIEELSATIEDISTQIKKNAANAKTSKDLAENATNSVQSANEQMIKMMQAMSNINESAQRISKIIKTIDDIAFQTNILALNAAVEAARAGDAGKGFSVVADEVRNLASKSAEAAKETALLIENSIVAVEQGTKIADDTYRTLGEIVEATKRSGEIVEQISEASTLQAQAITETMQGVGQISNVVQTNAATAEQSAAASEELSGQAGILNQLVGKFTLFAAEEMLKDTVEYDHREELFLEASDN